MKLVLDFILSALPWVAIGMFAACSVVMVQAKSQKKELSRLFLAISWAPALCFLITAILEFTGGSSSRGTTWLVLAVFNAVTNFANLQKKE